MKLLRHLLRYTPISKDAEALQDAALPLMKHLLHLEQEILALPPLPAAVDGEPRLMELARDAADHGQFGAQDLINHLSAWEMHRADSREVTSFPQCIALAQCHRLTNVLRAMDHDRRERQAAVRLAQKLKRCKRPESVMEKNNLTTIGLASLLCLLREEQQHQLLSLTETWLEARQLSADALILAGTQRQVQLAEELRRSLTCFDALSRLDWLAHCSAADDMHALLLQEPSGVYPRMMSKAQLQLRQRIARVSRFFRMAETPVVRQAFILCGEAEERSLESYIGYWFQEAEGLTALQKSLPTRRGWFFARLSLRQDKLRYVWLWVFAIATGFLFLQGRQPVFMLPFFALTAGCISRALVHKRPAPTLPALAVDPDDPDMRTLVVIHAVLGDPHEAIRAVRAIKTARHAFPGERADILLLGDFTPAITAVSSGDFPIIQAASAAVSALDDSSRIMYIQRGRTWNAAQHHYGPRAGWRGAVSEICRLIAQGECADLLAFSTVEARSFERKYAYVLALSADVQPAHGLLERLLQTMAHPLCQRFPYAKGYRGHAILLPEEAISPDTAALIRPDAFLEATDGLLPDDADATALCGELCGQTNVDGAHVRPPASDESWTGQYRKAVQAWQYFRWQLPWVETPSGVVSNPLSFVSRHRLREQLRRTLVPLGQCALLLWAMLTQNRLLFLLAFIAPEAGRSITRPEQLLLPLCRASLLPSRMAVNISAIIQTLRGKPHQSPDWPTLEVWAQGIAATITAALIFVLPDFSLPTLMVSVLFALFPLARRYLDTPVLPDEPLTDEHIALLDDAASSTWRYFDAHFSESNRHLPPFKVQYEPELDPDAATSPEAIGAALLSCICAKELGLISASNAAARIRHTADSLADLPMPFGLPARRYLLPTLTVADPQVDARSVGFLLAALMTTAQALRTWLPELPMEDALLSARLTGIADSFDLSCLYDREAALFFAGLDENGQGVDYITNFADEGLLLSVVACARRVIPPEHFARLDRTCINLNSGDIPLSRHGNASAHLLAGLFLPIDAAPAVRYVRTMLSRGLNGLFGQDDCAHFGFDPAMRYRRAVLGIPELSSAQVSNMPVYAPYAAALCLPFAPVPAADALRRFRDIGAFGPEGFCDAADLTNGTALVGMHDTVHQGLILAAAASILADSPIRRYFCALPEVEACLPLLTSSKKPIRLPAVRRKKRKTSQIAIFSHNANLLTMPADAHLLGNPGFHMLTDAAGSSEMYDGDIPITQHANRPHGIQFYLADEGRVYRLGSPLLQGTVTFTSGETRYEQLCGSLRAELVCTVDTVRRRAVHMLTITNLSTRDRMFDLADFLLPDLNVPPDTLMPYHPERGRLTLHARGTDVTLYHTLNANQSPLNTTVCTDSAAFLGYGRSLHQPSSLEDSPRDILTVSAAPCLSFRMRLSIGGRGQASAWFTTSLLDTPAPQLAELIGIRKLAALQHEAVTDAAALTPAQELLANRMVGPVHAAKNIISVTLDDHFHPETLHDLLAITGWFRFHGCPIELHAHCTENSKHLMEESLHGHIAEEHVRFVESSSNGLLLHGDLPLAEQIDALYIPLPSPTAVFTRPIPALLPKKELLHRGSFGGFDPETLDYIIELEPGQTPPAAWTNRHHSRCFTEIVSESGIREPFEEQVWIRMDDSTLLSPWSTDLPRAIRMGAGETSWETWTDTLDVRLTASNLPGHRCGMRILRIRNAGERPVTLQINVLSRLADDESSLECAPGMLLTHAEGNTQSFLAGEGWDARRTAASTLLNITDDPSLDLPDTPHGRTAQLTNELTLAPGASGQLAWLAGHARHSEDVARALHAVQTHGTTELLRTARARWSDILSAITIDTPEATLNLLMNRILPVQALSAADAESIPAYILLAPKEAMRRLIRSAKSAASPSDLARLALLTAAYTHRTADTSLADVYLSAQDATLYTCCKRALLSVPIDKRGLPDDDDSAHCFLYAAAAGALNNIHPDDDLAELRRRLLNAADTHLWQDSHYGEPLRLDVQHLACLAYGETPRTRQAVQTCLAALYDRPHGLIRRQEPNAAPVLPGLPENGGMVTLDAAAFLYGLLTNNQPDEAFEVLQALNPLHHTDDEARQGVFRCAPYQLHGGMYASPLEAGRATPDGGDKAAAVLYAVVLTQLLGFQRKGSVIRMNPRVPSDWEEYTISLREGTSTWRISVERRTTILTIDGDEVGGSEFTIRDDGKIHRVHIPMT